MEITIYIPEAVGQQLQKKWDNLSQKTLEALAIQAYRDGVMTSAEIQTLLNLSSRGETNEFLKLHQVYPDYTEEDLAKDVKNIEQLDNYKNISETQLGFGEFIQKFRQEHNLAQEGIESEELLKEVRDLSSGREVIW